MDGTLILLFGRARALVLHAFFDAAHGGVALHLREIARRTQLSPTAVQYELRLLRQLDLIHDVGTETRPTYELNRQHAYHDDLRRMFTRAESGLLFDEPRLEEKRVRQRAERRQPSEANSPFLRRARR